MLDWQVCRYASPVTDILYYIFGCTSSAFRSEHYENLLNDYYNSLSIAVKRLGTDPEKVFSYTAFRDEIKKYGAFGFVVSMMTLPFFSSHIDDKPDFDYLSERACKGQAIDLINCTSPQSNAIYNDRMSNMLRDSDKLGYI